MQVFFLGILYIKAHPSGCATIFLSEDFVILVGKLTSLPKYISGAVLIAFLQ